MELRIIYTLILSTTLTGCGLTALQKQQVSQFATATESISQSTQKQFTSMRDKVVEMEKARLIMRKEVPPKSFDLDGGLSSSGVATQISTLKALQSYGDVLNKLVSNDQSEAISKAATDFLTQYETAKLLNEPAYSLDQSKKDSIIGIINIANSWFIENEKKKSVKRIVKTYSSEINSLADLIRNDITLTGSSLCIEKGKRKKDNIKTGIIDIYCTSADALKEISKDALRNKKYSFSEREFAYNSYILSEKAIQEVRQLSRKGNDLVDNLINANRQLTKVIESDSYTKDYIKNYANQVEELLTLTNVLIGKEGQ